jgi:hypothetical protein
MSAEDRLAPAARRDLLSRLLALEPATRVETARDGFLHVEVPESVPVRFHWYPYPLVEPSDELDGLAVASLVDLVLMKLGAVISRGSRRDFVDLHLACRRLPLDRALALAERKFAHVGDFALQVFKALADLADAESEPMPELATPLDWSEVRAWALEEAARGGRAALEGARR